MIDAARGVAIVAMVVFHVAWDLYYFGYSALDVTADPGWVAFQKSIVTCFLLLVGVGLGLGHGDGVRWRPFWRRFAIILGAALLTTAGTYFTLPQYFVYFGILHAIAAFSLSGLLFVRGWWGIAVLAGLGFIAAAFLVPAHPEMMRRELSWIGFWPLPPPTTDIVPFFPWFGVVLLGIGGIKLARRLPLWPRLAGLRLGGLPGRTLRLMGRWSLVIYLVHQPLLFGIFTLMPQPPQTDGTAFVQSCEKTCAEGGGEAGFCARYCLCALEQVEAGNLWAAIERPDTATAEQAIAVDAVTRLCEAMALAP